MALNPELVFEQKYLSPPLIRALGLPDDTWSLVVNDAMDSAYFLNSAFRPMTLALTPDMRPLIERAAQQKREAELALPLTARRRSLIDS